MKIIFDFIKKNRSLICLVLAFLIGLCILCDIVLNKQMIIEKFEDNDMDKDKDWWFLEKCPDEITEIECQESIMKQKEDWNKKFDIYKTRFSLDKLVEEDMENDGVGTNKIKKMIGEKYNLHTHKQNNMAGETDAVKIENSLPID
jgi:hypothetical protein